MKNEEIINTIIEIVESLNDLRTTENIIDILESLADKQEEQELDQYFAEDKNLFKPF